MRPARPIAAHDCLPPQAPRLAVRRVRRARQAVVLPGDRPVLLSPEGGAPNLGVPSGETAPRRRVAAARCAEVRCARGLRLRCPPPEPAGGWGAGSAAKHRGEILPLSCVSAACAAGFLTAPGSCSGSMMSSRFAAMARASELQPALAPDRLRGADPAAADEARQIAPVCAELRQYTANPGVFGSNLDHAPAFCDIAADFAQNLSTLNVYPRWRYTCCILSLCAMLML